MKTFFNLIQEIQKEGKCNLCGGCVTFCSAINHEALGVDSDGWPYFKAIDKCIECGLCYSICSQTNELDNEIKKDAQWKEPFGKVIEISVARAKDESLRDMGTDGAIVSAILIHLFDTQRIDGAIVSKNTRYGRVSFLAKSKEDIFASTGIHFTKSHGMVDFAHDYSTFSPSTSELKELKNHSLERVAFVGVPCQINTIRKMQALDLVPSEIIKYCFGIFCSGNYYFSERFLNLLEEKYGFSCKEVKKINVKEAFIISLFSGEQVLIPLHELDRVKRLACDFCDDFSAGYADISFGGTGAPSGWTTAITRTQIGKAVFNDALKNKLETYRVDDNPQYITLAEKKIKIMSELKKQRADYSKTSLENAGIKVIG
ncbi:MAG: Coenzyme F420 hydrogenase/dehydrogenase, beta subunit C-terminal domain [Proteobacteria bacterium]|nr:Coenzyme F420 hydrogenase/dehydrogenase, beta subunit C-terminal domain [Pseudomonadota bacterium]MBU1585459.1 Coenzyme F420 hydrogenase/dehydrogenase, beta subunit C-terminal domain [Pseudomonadota bacterium]MBU2455962.1 Coenzyme F420 hydrogenase/dehydrogenase, beta subunit C-terminal domain [Pseudomonadota bacterium]